MKLSEKGAVQNHFLTMARRPKVGIYRGTYLYYHSLMANVKGFGGFSPGCTVLFSLFCTVLHLEKVISLCYFIVKKR